MERILREISGSEYVEYCSERGLVFAWNGVCTVTVFDVTGRARGAFPVGDSTCKSADLGDVKEDIAAYGE